LEHIVAIVADDFACDSYREQELRTGCGIRVFSKRRMVGYNATVIRGGFRIAYNPEFYNLFTNVAGGAPFVNLGQVSNCPNCLPASGNGADVRSSDLALIPRGVDPGTRKQTLVAPNLHNPYAEQWNLGVQRQLGSRIVGELRYVGNRGVGLFQDVNTNPALNALTSA